MDCLHAAIIGCGGISAAHLLAIHSCGLTEEDVPVKLVAVADIVEEKAQKVAQQEQCDWYTDYREMLKRDDIDVVHICTPHYLHHSMAIDAMRAGKHVFCEKPMAIHADDAQKMEDVSRETGKKLGICFQNRYNHTSQTAKELIDSGEVGKVLGGKAVVTWFRGKEYYASGAWRGRWDTEGGGVLINQAIHSLDLLNWLCGGSRAVKAHHDQFMMKGIIEVEDTVMANLLLKNGGNALFFATNCYVASTLPLIEVVCERAVLTIDDNLVIRYTDGSGRVETVSNENKRLIGKAVYGSGHPLIIQDFYNCVAQDRPFFLCGAEGKQAIRIIQAIYDSDRTGSYVEY